MNSKRYERRKLIIHIRSKGRLLSESFEEVLSAKATDLRPATIRSYSLAIRNYLRIIGDTGIDEISPREADLFKSNRSKEVSLYSVNVDLRALKTIFSTLVRWKYCNSNPFQDVKLLRIPECNIRFFSEEELRNLILSISDVQFKSLILFSYFTGCRLGEIVFLRWNSVNLESRTISVENSENFVTKSKRIRLLPMNDSLFEVLKKLSNKKISDYVFPGPNGKPYRCESVSRRFKRLLEQKNFDPKLHFHSLRHTNASHLVQKNVPIYDVCKLLGHSSVKVTERYAHLQTQDRRELVNKLNLFQINQNTGETNPDLL